MTEDNTQLAALQQNLGTLTAENSAYWHQAARELAKHPDGAPLARSILHALLGTVGGLEELWLDVADLALAQGDKEYAHSILVSLVQHHDQDLRYWLHGLRPSLRKAAAESIPEAHSHIVTRPCSILHGASRAAQNRIIEATLTAHHDAWERGETPPPAHQDVFTGAATSIEDWSTVRILIAMPQWAECRPELGAAQPFYVFTRSARRNNLNVRQFGIDDISNERHHPLDPEKSAVAMAALEAEIAENRPDLIFFSINFINIVEHALTPQIWDAWRTKYRFKLIGVAFDCFHNLTQWTPVCDQVVIFENRRRLVPWNLVAKTRLGIVAIHDEEMFRPDLPKDLFFTFRGRVGFDRNRLAMMTWLTDVLTDLSRPCHVALHDRTSHLPDVSIEEYAELYRRSRLTYSDGYQNQTFHHKPGRVLEAIWSKCLLLNEIGSDIDKYFVPFVHYIPTNSAEQVEAYLRFFAEREDWWTRITDAAYDWAKQRYSSRLFWQWMLAGPFPA